MSTSHSLRPWRLTGQLKVQHRVAAYYAQGPGAPKMLDHIPAIGGKHLGLVLLSMIGSCIEVIDVDNDHCLELKNTAGHHDMF